MRERLIQAFVNMEEQETARIAREMLASGTPPMEVLETCNEALEIVGRRFECGEAFLPELMIAGEMMEALSGLLKPLLKDAPERKNLGKVVIGTVAGDVHDIGKNIVTFLLDAQGFEVIDLGVDVPVARFVETIRESGAKVVGLSGLLTLAFDSMKATVDAIAAAGLRDQVKIMVGGAPVNEQVCTYAGADAWGMDAVQGVNLAKEWLGGAA
jgi:5-methyltetrahydrofolate--homocysteine methyltransferase